MQQVAYRFVEKLIRKQAENKTKDAWTLCLYCEGAFELSRTLVDANARDTLLDAFERFSSPADYDKLEKEFKWIDKYLYLNGKRYTPSWFGTKVIRVLQSKQNNKEIPLSVLFPACFVDDNTRVTLVFIHLVDYALPLFFGLKDHMSPNYLPFGWNRPNFKMVYLDYLYATHFNDKIGSTTLSVLSSVNSCPNETIVTKENVQTLLLECCVQFSRIEDLLNNPLVYYWTLFPQKPQTVGDESRDRIFAKVFPKHVLHWLFVDADSDLRRRILSQKISPFVADVKWIHNGKLKYSLGTKVKSMRELERCAEFQELMRRHLRTMLNHDLINGFKENVMQGILSGDVNLNPFVKEAIRRDDCVLLYNFGTELNTDNYQRKQIGEIGWSLGHAKFYKLLLCISKSGYNIPREILVKIKVFFGLNQLKTFNRTLCLMLL